MVPLLPRHGVLLFAPAGGGSRFAGLFREVWRAIPLGDRRLILRHWRRTDPVTGLVAEQLGVPRVGLLVDWNGREGASGYQDGKPARRGRALYGVKAVALHGGHALLFWRPIVRAYPDSLVCDLISHELAHVVQAARGLTFTSRFDLETDADYLVHRWGFLSEAIDAWDMEHGVTRDGGASWDAILDHLNRYGR